MFTTDSHFSTAACKRFWSARLPRFVTALAFSSFAASVFAQTDADLPNATIEYGSAQAEESAAVEPILDDKRRVVSTKALVNVYTGPDASFPIFYVVERGETLRLLDERVDWLQVELSDGTVGWTKKWDLFDRTTELTRFERYQARKWEIAVMGGALDGANSISLAVHRKWSENLSTSGFYTRSFDDFFSSDVWGFQLLHEPFPNWNITPYFSLGAGNIDVSPDTDIVEAEDLNDNYVSVGTGVSYPIRDNFAFRIEYQHLTQLTTSNDNREIHEWKAGFSVFY